jgi:putative YhdH/YhfP family quinone oxidoreductase
LAKTFRALVVRETENHRFERAVTQRVRDDLPKEGNVLVRVHYSSLNYKDALSATGNKGVSRHYPHTPGVDAAGVVEESGANEIRPGDEVIVTGYDLGMNTPGGFAEYIRVPAGWVVRRPPTLSLRESMIYGTAGFTAALSVQRLLQHGVHPDQGEVLVTGATGGVGSVAVGLLAKAGFRVVAATGKSQEAEFLKRLGAGEILPREQAVDPTGAGLLKARWAGAVDTVGGEMLSTALRALKPHGAATCCGLVASKDLTTPIFPFILRGVSLLGIDSAQTPMPVRLAVWQKLAGDWKLPMLESLVREVTLEQLDPEIDRILKGEQKGRVIVKLV